jgi:glutaredoxin
MARVLLIALLVAGAYTAWENLRGVEPLYAEPYIVVYGRDGCGWTKQMRKKLDTLSVPYEYRSVDDPGVSDPMHDRMTRSGLKTDRYMLPVVDVSGALFVSPKPDAVLAALRDSTAAASTDRS